MTKREIARDLALNAQRLMAAIDEWIDQLKKQPASEGLPESLRRLCLERAYLRLRLHRLIVAERTRSQPAP